jgi:ubiquitin-conjugating enzyme E2 O
VDLPIGIEVPITLLPEYDLGLKKTQNSTLQLNNSKIQGSKMGTSSLQIKTNNIDRFSGTKAAPNKKKSSASHHFGLDLGAKKGSSSSSSFHSSFVGHNASLYPQGIESGNPWLNSSDNFDPPSEHARGKTRVRKSARVAHNGQENETLRKFRSFKQFDTVNDTSDHHFVNKKSSMTQVS